MYRNKSKHYEHLMIVKSCEVGVLEILYLSPWYNDIYLEYTMYMYMHIKWNASISFLHVCVLISVVVFVFQLITLIK